MDEAFLERAGVDVLTEKRGGKNTHERKMKDDE